MPVNLPYVVYGTVTDSESSNPSGVRVTTRNDTNGETINTTTNGSGQYAVDLGNFTSGYKSTDRVTVVCAYGLEYDDSSFLISADTHEVDLTLVEESASADLTYCQVQDVLDELGGKTTSDISYERVRKIILRAEEEIEERAGASFTTETVTDEEYDFDQYTAYKSADQLLTYRNDYLVGSRNDYWNSSMVNKFKMENNPIVNPKTQLNGATTAAATTLTVDSTADFPSSGTIFIYNSTNGTEAITYTGKTSTTFTGCTRATNSTTATAHADNSYVTMIRASRNTAGVSSTDSWEDLEPQVGGGGDFIIDNTTGLFTLVDNYPALGSRKIKISYTYGSTTVPKIVERLCILLSVRDVLLSTGSSLSFDDTGNINLEEISVSGGSATRGVGYLKFINEEIERLWKIVGDMSQRFV